MSLKQGRPEDIRFTIGSLTADSQSGTFTSYSDRPLIGTIQRISLFPNTYTTTGSLLIFNSGLYNSGTALGGLLFTLRAGSTGDFYPKALVALNNGLFLGGSGVFTDFISNDIIRVVGSGLGVNTSGIGLIITYK